MDQEDKENCLRIDMLLVEKKLAQTRTKAAELIKRGMVSADNKTVKKPSELFPRKTKINVSGELPFVGRGGEKIEEAFTRWNIDVKNKIVLDIGSSTGGFTDASLKRGAKKVYAIDVGKNQLDPSLRINPDVISMEETDIRTVSALPEIPDIIVIDVSFISLTEVLPIAQRLVKKTGYIIALVKPQFETGPGYSKDGVVKNESVRLSALHKIITEGKNLGLHFLDSTDSPILGKSGNKEYLALFRS